MDNSLRPTPAGGLDICGAARLLDRGSTRKGCRKGCSGRGTAQTLRIMFTFTFRSPPTLFPQCSTESQGNDRRIFIDDAEKGHHPTQSASSHPKVGGSCCSSRCTPRCIILKSPAPYSPYFSLCQPLTFRSSAITFHFIPVFSLIASHSF